MMADKEETERVIDSVTDQEREIAQNALSEFKKKNFVACLQHLNKLDARSNDFKVAHNKTVAEFYKNDLKKVDHFQKNLASICSQFRIKLDKLDDVDHCVIHFNQAVVLYHQRQYTAAVRIMDKVYKFIEPIDDALAKQVTLLAIELQLCLRQPDKALTYIRNIENQLLGITNPTGMKILDRNIKEKEKKAQVVQPSNDPVVEEFRKKLRKYKARCYLMKHSMSSVNSELQILLKTKGNVEAMFLAANYEFLKGNLQESIKILTSIPNDCLVYGDSGESSTVMFYNNMGIIHHAMGKHNLACFYFQKALKEDIALTSRGKNENDKPLYCLGGSKYHELMYNLGISLLYSHKPSQAFECLIVAVRRYHRNSRLWMRIAECCIMLHKPSNEVDFDIQKKQREMVVDVVGTREKQKVILTTNLSKDRKYSTESQSYAVPVPSLEFASLCLRNAYLLLPTDTASNPVPLFLIPGVTPPAPPPSPGPAPSSPLSPDSVMALRNAILAASAYVAICLGDYIMALEYAKDLLAQPKTSGGHKLLAHLYAAEALVLLDKIPDALNYLNPDHIKDIVFEFAQEPSTSSEENCTKTSPPSKWFPDNLMSAHAVMHYNIAVAKTIRGQLEQAEALLKQVWQQRNASCKVPAHILMLVIYIELQLGHADVARNLLKQYSFQHRWNG